MRKNTSQTIRRALYVYLLIGEGLLVGAAAGIVVMLYRIALTYAGQWMNAALDWMRGDMLRTALWFAALLVMALIVSRLVKWEPMISGQRHPSGGGRNTGETYSEVEKGSSGEVLRRFPVSAGWSFSWKGRSVDSAGRHERAGASPGFSTAGKQRRDI